MLLLGQLALGRAIGFVGRTHELEYEFGRKLGWLGLGGP